MAAVYTTQALKWFVENKIHPDPEENDDEYFPFTFVEAKRDFDKTGLPFPVNGIPIWMHHSNNKMCYVFQVGDEFVVFEMKPDRKITVLRNP